MLYTNTDIKHRFKGEGKGFKKIYMNFEKYSYQIPPIKRISPYYGLEKLFSNLGSELQDSKRTKFDFTAVLTTPYCNRSKTYKGPKMEFGKFVKTIKIYL